MPLVIKGLVWSFRKYQATNPTLLKEDEEDPEGLGVGEKEKCEVLWWKFVFLIGW